MNDAAQDGDSPSSTGSESDAEAKPKKTSQRTPKSPKSPYSSSPSLHPKKAAENRHGDGSPGAWLSPTQSDPAVQHTGSASSSTPEYLKEALGMKKPKHSRFSSGGYIPGTPDYKEKEDMYDEIIELKKKIQAQKSEADRMKTKLRRLEEDNNRKDKQIDQLLESSSKSSELMLTRTEQKNVNCAVMSALKQKILRLEQQCKEKDTCINKLQSEVKSINAEETRRELTLQTYYEEIQRLQILLAKLKTVQRTTPPKNQEQKVLSTAVLQLSRSIQELQEENQNLRADLDRALGCSHANHYAEKGKQRRSRQSSKWRRKMDEDERLQLSETGTTPLLSSSPVAPSDLSAAQESASPEQEHFRRVIKKLRGQTVLLQNQLSVKEEEIWRLTLSVKELQEEHNARQRQTRVAAAEPSDRELHIGGTASGPTTPHPPEQLRRKRAAQIIQRRWRARKAKIEGDALNQGAVALQAALGGHFSRQSVLAGNPPSMLKKNRHSSPERSSAGTPLDCKAEEEAVRLIQSIFRAHITRAPLVERPQICSHEEQKTSPTASNGEKKPVWSIFKPVPLVFTSGLPATSSQDQPHSSPVGETDSDDSDDIITVSSSPPVKEKAPFDFSSYLSHSLLHS